MIKAQSGRPNAIAAPMKTGKQTLKQFPCQVQDGQGKSDVVWSYQVKS